MEEENEGMTFGEIIRLIWSRKWLAIIVAAVIAILGMVILVFGYNRNAAMYSSTFTVSLPGSSAENPVYPDGTPFNYRELVSSANLKAATEAEGLESVDAERLYTSGRTSIERKVSDDAGTKDVTYTVTMAASFFKDAAQADKFVAALTQMPLDKVNGLAVGQDIYLKGYDETDFLENKLDLLERQAAYLSGALSSLSANVGGPLKNSTVKIMTDLENFTRKLDALSGELDREKYVHDLTEAKTFYEDLRENVTKEYNEKLRALLMLFGYIDVDEANLPQTVPSLPTAPPDSMVQLANQVSSLRTQKEHYESYLSEDEGKGMKSVTPEFSAKLQSLYNELKGLTDSYETNLAEYYNTSATVLFNGPVAETGSMGLLMCALISVLAGVIIGAVVGFIAGYVKKSKAETSADASASA